MKCPYCEFVVDTPEDLVCHWEDKREEGDYHFHTVLRIQMDFAKMIADTIPRSVVEALIKELEGIRDTINRASENESWATVTSGWQLTQNMIWKLKELLEKK